MKPLDSSFSDSSPLMKSSVELPISNQIDYRELFISRYKQDQGVPYFLRQMSVSEVARNQAKKQLLSFGTSIKDKLQWITKETPSNKQLSDVYYAKEILLSINKQECLQEWEKLLLRNEQNRHLEDGALIIAKWQYPDLDLVSIYRQLDQIAGELRDKINNYKIAHSMHSSELLPPVTILKLLKELLFDQMGFYGNANDYYNPKNSFLNDILERKCGIPISLSVLVTAIARRVGIRLVSIGFPTHFLLKCELSESKDNTATTPPTTPPMEVDQEEVTQLPDGTDLTDSGGDELFIDAFNRGQFLSTKDCRELLRRNAPDLVFSNHFLEPISSLKVFLRMLANLLNVYKGTGQHDQLIGIVEQILFLKPDSLDEFILKLRVMMVQQRYQEVQEDLLRYQEKFTIPPFVVQNIKNQIEPHLDSTPVEKSRSNPEFSQVKYHVGDIITHKKFGYRGVVSGYTSSCEASGYWQLQMGVTNLTYGPNQPFYSVLVCSKEGEQQTTYVAQENIILNSSETSNNNAEHLPLNRSDIGKFFQEFDPARGVYIPNQELLSQYPQL